MKKTMILRYLFLVAAVSVQLGGAAGRTRTDGERHPVRGGAADRRRRIGAHRELRFSRPERQVHADRQ